MIDLIRDILKLRRIAEWDESWKVHIHPGDWTALVDWTELEVVLSTHEANSSLAKGTLFGMEVVVDPSIESGKPELRVQLPSEEEPNDAI